MAEPLAEKVVQPAINTDHVAYCTTMDLIAVSTVDSQAHVFRLNGQKVFGVSNKQQPGRVGQLQWKPNGQILAVALNNHDLSLTNAHTGKQVHLVDCSKYSKSRISCLGWGVTFADGRSLSRRLLNSVDGITIEDVISRNPSIKSIEAPPDLPLDLAFLDVEGSLPKLSPLTFGGIEDDVFSSRASMDSIFQPLTTASTDSTDVLVVGFEDGTIHISIYDFFEIGTFNLISASSDAEILTPIMHSSHPLSTTHTLLASNGEDLKVVPIDLRLISIAGRYLSSLASKANQLRSILRYLHQVQRQLNEDFKASQDLPKRFIRNIEDDLKENSDVTWEQAAYHLVVTGNCYPEVKDWLVDQLGERVGFFCFTSFSLQLLMGEVQGYKRWDKAVVTGYESVRRLIHEHFLPALERFTVLVSRLRGLSKFQVTNTMLGLSTQDLNNVLDTVSCLQVVAHHVLITTSVELHQFNAFSGWLHQEIGIQSSDASPSDGPEKDLNIDHIRTLEYIQGAMMQSRLSQFLSLEAEAGVGSRRDLKAEGPSLFDLYKRQTNQKDIKDPSKQLPGFEGLLRHLDDLCSILFGQIGETQRRNVRIASPISLGSGMPDRMDLRMVIEEPEKLDKATLYVAVGPRLRQAVVEIYRIEFSIKNGMSTTKDIECASLRLGSWSLKDIKFVDDKEILLAMSHNSSSGLFRLSYRNVEGQKQFLRYRKAAEAQDGGFSIDFSDSEQVEARLWLDFPTGIGWEPERIEVNGRKGRRVVCVFAQDKFHYRIYDLDGSNELEEQNEREDAKCDITMGE